MYEKVLREFIALSPEGQSRFDFFGRVFSIDSQLRAPEESLCIRYEDVVVALEIHRH